MAKKRKVKGFTLTQQLDPQYWRFGDIDPQTEGYEYNEDEAEFYGYHWTDFENPDAEGQYPSGHIVESAINGTPEALGLYLIERLEGLHDMPGNTEGLKHPKVTSAYIIKHDRDTQPAFDDNGAPILDENGNQAQAPKALHVHMVVTMDEELTFDEIGYLMGVQSNYIEALGVGKWGVDNPLSYLIHIKYPEKYQYEASDVVTLRGRPYGEIYAERREAWLKARNAVRVGSINVKEMLNQMIADCLVGELTKGQILLDDAYSWVYAKNRAKIDDALSVYAQKRGLRAARRLENGEFRTRVIYVQGAAGAGKSYWAKNILIPRLIEQGRSQFKEEWAIYSGGAMASLDNYSGEEIVLLDDIRPNAMSASEWLRLLDPEHANTAHARYRNKENVAPRYIVMTAVHDPAAFFVGTNRSADLDEPLDQFLRRISLITHVYRIDSNTQGYVVGSVVDVPTTFTVGYQDIQTQFSIQYSDGVFTSQGATDIALDIVMPDQKAIGAGEKTYEVVAPEAYRKIKTAHEKGDSVSAVGGSGIGPHIELSLWRSLAFALSADPMDAHAKRFDLYVSDLLSVLYKYRQAVHTFEFFDAVKRAPSDPLAFVQWGTYGPDGADHISVSQSLRASEMLADLTGVPRPPAPDDLSFPEHLKPASAVTPAPPVTQPVLPISVVEDENK